MIEVSIITPTYNRAHLIPRVWNSLKTQESEFEWIITDDGSTDDTATVVASLGDERIRYVKLPENQGLNAARSVGVVRSNGKYIIFIDSDDELYPNVLKKMICILDASDPSVGAAVFQCIEASNGEVRHRLPGGQLLGEYEVVVQRVFRSDSSVIYKREVFDSFHLDDDPRGGGGVFVFAVSTKFKFLTVDHPGSIVHMQGDNRSSAESVIARASEIALSWERVLHNHRQILDRYPDARAIYLNKALYRYVLARNWPNALRMFCKAFVLGDKVRACGILALLLTGTASAVELFRHQRARQQMRIE